MASNEKGSRRERELVRKLDDSEFAVMRAPASGSATDRDLPDVLAGRADRTDESSEPLFYAIEAKSSSGNPIYLDREEVDSLVFFARNFGAKPRIAVRFDRQPWYFFHPEDCYTTDGGNHRVKLETATESGTPYDAFAEGAV